MRMNVRRSVSDADHYVTLENYSILLPMYFRYSYPGGMVKRLPQDFFFRKVAVLTYLTLNLTYYIFKVCILLRVYN
jgi:hypothetical protein